MNGQKTDLGIRQLKRTPGLSPTEKAVLSELHEHAGTSGACYPSVAEMCDGTGYSQRTIQGATKNLARKGLIQVQARTGTSNHYQICYPAVDRGHSPIENRPERRVNTPKRSSPAEPRSTLAMFRSAEALEDAAQEHGMSQIQLIQALSRSQARAPDNLPAYFSSVITRHKNGIQPLPPPDAETIVGLRADLARLRRGRALA